MVVHPLADQWFQVLHDLARVPVHPIVQRRLERVLNGTGKNRLDIAVGGGRRRALRHALDRSQGLFNRMACRIGDQIIVSHGWFPFFAKAGIALFVIRVELRCGFVLRFRLAGRRAFAFGFLRQFQHFRFGRLLRFNGGAILDFDRPGFWLILGNDLADRRKDLLHGRFLLRIRRCAHTAPFRRNYGEPHDDR